MMSNLSERTPRQLFFTTGEDLYFLTYNLVIVLSILGASAEKPLKDCNSLAVLVTLIADSQLLDLIERYKTPIKKASRDYHLLLSAASRARRKRPYLARLHHALARRGIVEIAGNPARYTIGLLPGASIRDFTEDAIFEQERANMKRLCKLIPRIKVMTAETLQRHVFQTRGVVAWPH